MRPSRPPHPLSLAQRLWIVLGALFVIAGLLTVWLPIPIGLPLMAVGTVVLVRRNPDTRDWIRHRRERHRRFDRLLRRLTVAAPSPLRRVLLSTCPRRARRQHRACEPAADQMT